MGNRLIAVGRMITGIYPICSLREVPSSSSLQLDERFVSSADDNNHCIWGCGARNDLSDIVDQLGVLRNGGGLSLILQALKLTSQIQERHVELPATSHRPGPRAAQYFPE